MSVIKQTKHSLNLSKPCAVNHLLVADMYRLPEMSINMFTVT